MPILDTALVAAFVSAIITMIGWLASHWSQRRLELTRRDEKIIDVQTALLAEIESNLDRYEEIDLDKHNAEIQRLIKSSRRSTYTPFVPRYPTEIIFEAIVTDIHILPTETIDEVVAYYKQELKLREMVEDLRSERFAALEQERKAQMFDHYIWQIKTVLVTGKEARDVLRTSLGRR